MYKEVKLADIIIGSEDTIKLYNSIDNEIIKINKSMDYIFINGLEAMHASPKNYIVYRLEEMLEYFKNGNKDLYDTVYELVKNGDQKAVEFYNGILNTTYITLKHEISIFIQKLNNAIKTLKVYNIDTYDIERVHRKMDEIYKIGKGDIQPMRVTTIINFAYWVYNDFILQYCTEDYFKNPETIDLLAILKNLLVQYRNLLMDIRDSISIRVSLPDMI